MSAILSGIRRDPWSTWIGRIGFGLVLATFFTLPLTTLRVGSVALGDVFVFFLICAIPFSVLAFGVRRSIVPRWMVIAFLLLLGSLVGTMLFAKGFSPELLNRLEEIGPGYPNSSVIWIRFVFALLLFPVIISQLLRNRIQIGWAASAWVAGVTVSCLVAAIDSVLGTGLQESFSYDSWFVQHLMAKGEDGEYLRYVGLTEHPNTLGLTAAMVCPLILVKMNSLTGLLRFGPLLVLAVAGVLLSGSRAAVLGLAVGTLAVLIFFRRPILDWARGVRARLDPRRTSMAAGYSLLLVVALAAIVFGLGPSSHSGGSSPTVVNRLAEPNSRSANVSNTERLESIKAGIEGIKVNPVFGSGFGWIEQPHNILLAMLLTGGILALLGFAWAVVGYLRTGFGLRGRVEAEPLVSACLASFLTFLAISPLTNQSFNRYLYLPLALILAIRMLYARAEADEPDSRG